MQIQQEQNDYPHPTRVSTHRHCLPPAEYVAVFRTHLALARWTRGGNIPHVYSSSRHAPVRAAWYAEAERQFQAWLEKGGFHAE